MTSLNYESTSLEPLTEVVRLETIVTYLRQQYEEALEMLRAAIVRAEGTPPLFRTLEGQIDFDGGK